MNSVLVNNLSYKKILRYCLLVLAFITSQIIYSQGPNEDILGGGLTSNDPPPAPIDNKIIFLLLLGLILAYTTFKQKSKKKDC